MEAGEEVRLLVGPQDAARIADFASRRNAKLLDEQPARPPAPSERLWQFGDELWLSYVEDSLFNAQYVIVSGAGAPELADQLCAEVSCRRLSDAIDKWINLPADAHPEHRINVVSALGILATQQFDKVVFDAMVAALSDPDPGVRYTAAFAVQLPAWPEFVPVLKARAAHELHPKVQEAVDAAVRGFALLGMP
jgi:hypothetical protein